MRVKAAGFWAVLVLSLVVAAGTSYAGEFPRPKVEYAADQRMHFESDGRSFDMQGRIYSAIDKERREHQFGGHESIHIARHDKGVSWTLMPQTKSYQEHPMGESKKKKGDKAPDWYSAADVKLEKIGKEEVAGHKTTKYRVNVTEKDGTIGKGFTWLTTQNIPVKIEGTFEGKGNAGKFRIEQENIKVGKQDRSLFEIPAGYTKFEIPRFSFMAPPDASDAAGESGDGSAYRDQMLKQIEEMKKRYQQP